MKIWCTFGEVIGLMGLGGRMEVGGCGRMGWEGHDCVGLEEFVLGCCAGFW